MMKGSGSALFTDPDDYQANLPGMVRLMAPRVRDFSARLTWMELTDLQLLHTRETAPRVAYLSLPIEFAFIAFPTHRTSALICDGVQLELGDIVIHSLGQRLHQRTTAATSWGLIALTPASLRAYGRTLTGINIALSPFGQILRSRPSDVRCLLRLHAEAIRIAETKLSHIGHAEVARAVQQEMIWALAGCLTNAEHRNTSSAMGHNVSVLMQLEDALTAHPCRRPRVSQVCNAIAVSERALRSRCLNVLGMGPARYVQLRHLERARLALLHAGDTMGIEAEVMQRHGFADLRHFVAAYRTAFGAPPRIGHRPDDAARPHLRSALQFPISHSRPRARGR
jgi:AraC-like DNA-binding protein